MPSLTPPVRATRRYDRADEFYPGIPNRDLTEDDWHLLSDDQRQTVIDSGLWTVEPDEKIQPKLERLEKQAEKLAEKAEKQAAREEHAAKDGGD